MATKGIQGNGITEKNAEAARQGQREKADARRARKAQQANRTPVVVVQAKPVGEEALHALFSRTGKVLAENHITREPWEVLAHSPELKKACRLHGWLKCYNRIAEAAAKFGLTDDEPGRLGLKATKAFR